MISPTLLRNPGYLGRCRWAMRKEPEATGTQPSGAQTHRGPNGGVRAMVVVFTELCLRHLSGLRKVIESVLV